MKWASGFQFHGRPKAGKQPLRLYNSTVIQPNAESLLTTDEARRMAANFAKRPELLRVKVATEGR
jgi:hypothetical protein